MAIRRLGAEKRVTGTPGLRARRYGHDRRMSDYEPDDTEESAEDDPLLAAQQGKGYGEDEGEREDSLSDE